MRGQDQAPKTPRKNKEASWESEGVGEKREGEEEVWGVGQGQEGQGDRLQEIRLLLLAEAGISFEQTTNTTKQCAPCAKLDCLRVVAQSKVDGGEKQDFRYEKKGRDFSIKQALKGYSTQRKCLKGLFWVEKHQEVNAELAKTNNSERRNQIKNDD